MSAYPDCARSFSNSAFFLVFGKRRTYASEDRLSIGNGIDPTFSHASGRRRTLSCLRKNLPESACSRQQKKPTFQ